MKNVQELTTKDLETVNGGLYPGLPIIGYGDPVEYPFPGGGAPYIIRDLGKE